MNNLIKLEEFSLFGLALYFLITLDFGLSWWTLFLLFFTPDIGMIGYVINAKWGAIAYNFFHHKLTGVIFLLIYAFFELEWMLLSGIILLGHTSFDRVFGYGLKFLDGFKHTHLGYLK